MDSLVRTMLPIWTQDFVLGSELLHQARQARSVGLLFDGTERLGAPVPSFFASWVLKRGSVDWWGPDTSQETDSHGHPGMRHVGSGIGAWVCCEAFAWRWSWPACAGRKLSFCDPQIACFFGGWRMAAVESVSSPSQLNMSNECNHFQLCSFCLHDYS